MFDFSQFLLLKKGNICVGIEPYTVHVDRKRQADIYFGSHFIAQKRCCPPVGSMVPAYSDLAFGVTTPSTSVCALELLSCGWFFFFYLI